MPHKNKKKVILCNLKVATIQKEEELNTTETARDRNESFALKRRRDLISCRSCMI